jgi:hypothetical protein
MFRKKTHWYTLACKALLFAGLLYKLSRLFMKSADKLADTGVYTKKSNKKRSF